MRTFHTGGVAGADDITQGLPRVEELFEARKPKHPGILSESAGTVSVQEKEDGRFVIITREDGTEDSYHIPYGAKLHIADGDHVEVGDRLTEGSLNPHDILRISGPAATRHYLVQQVLSVYKSQGVEINDKHVEVMVRQMMRKYRIDDAGDTKMLPGSVVDIAQFEDENDEVMAEGKEPAPRTSDPPRDHQSFPGNRFLPVSCFLPGNDEKPDRRRHQRQSRSAPWS